MTTTVNKTIGTTGSPNFSTIQTWEDAIPVNITAAGSDQIHVGQQTTNLTVSSGAACTFSGTVTDSSHTIALAPGAGLSFKDNASAQSNPLRALTTNGVLLTHSTAYASALVISEDNVFLSGLQVRKSGAGGGSPVAMSGSFVHDINQCIFENASGGPVVFLAGASAIIKNSLLVLSKASSANGVLRLDSSATAYGCTAVVPTGVAAPAGILQGAYGSTVVENCALYGNGAPLKVSGGNTPAYANCASDAASLPTGVASLAYASAGFVAIAGTGTTHDYRLSSAAAGLCNIGHNYGLSAIDIVGTSRPQGSDYDIGCWEVQVAAGNSIAVPAGSLTLSGKVPTVSLSDNKQISVPAGSLSVTAFAPTIAVTANQQIAVPAGSLTLTGFAPSVSVSDNKQIAVPAGSLTLTAFAPTVSVSDNKSVAVPAGSLTLTGFAPAVVATANQFVAVPAGAVTLTGLAPDVQATANQFIAVPAASLTLTGFPPDVVRSGNQLIAVDVGTLTLTAFAPDVVVSLHRVILVPAGALALTGLAPSVAVSDRQDVDVPAGALTLTGFAPDVEATANVTIDVPAASLGLEAFAPNVVVGAQVIIDVPSGQLVLTGYAPVVSNVRKVVQIRLCISDDATGSIAIGDGPTGLIELDQRATGTIAIDDEGVKCEACDC